ncbi:MAG: ABC transporter permease subunit, partial [Propionibacteriaceae bacterium]|nr:ABC transporter permease subunit [Propionibacteriaceae bacterium]
MTSLPRWVWLPFAVGIAVFVVPLAGMLWRVPWTRVAGLLTSAEAQQALALSLGTCIVATGISVTLGAVLAIVLARSSGAWVGAVRTLLTVPMVLPPVVAGLALLVTLGRRGPVGEWLSRAGIELGFTTTAVVIAQVFVSMPYLVIALEGALRVAGDGYERVAANLGASPSRVLWRVTLPMALPGLA